MKEYNINKLTSYLHRVNDRLEKYVTAIRADIEQNVVSWPECERLAEAANLAEWVGHQVHHLEGIAKEQRFNFGYLYRCKQSDPLEVVKAGRVYNNNARMNPHGGNDFWEQGVVEPDVALSDLIRILHPDLLPDHQLVYHRLLE